MPWTSGRGTFWTSGFGSDFPLSGDEQKWFEGAHRAVG
jgi:hypothetical protein